MRKHSLRILLLLFFCTIVAACDQDKQTQPAQTQQSQAQKAQAETQPEPGVATQVETQAETQAETTTQAPASAPLSGQDASTAPMEATTGGTANTNSAVEPMTQSSDSPDQLTLARSSGCLACHKVDAKVVGPAWKDVAARYSGDAKSKQVLINKIKKGGKGNWTKVTGGIAMPPYSPRVSDANIETLVDFILSLK